MSVQTQSTLTEYTWRPGNANRQHEPWKQDHTMCPSGCGTYIHQNTLPEHIRVECDGVDREVRI